MEPHQECAYDHIVVYDGHTTESRHRELDQMELTLLGSGYEWQKTRHNF